MQKFEKRTRMYVTIQGKEGNFHHNQKPFFVQPVHTHTKWVPLSPRLRSWSSFHQTFSKSHPTKGGYFEGWPDEIWIWIFSSIRVWWNIPQKSMSIHAHVHIANQGTWSHHSSIDKAPRTCVDVTLPISLFLFEAPSLSLSVNLSLERTFKNGYWALSSHPVVIVVRSSSKESRPTRVNSHDRTQTKTVAIRWRYLWSTSCGISRI